MLRSAAPFALALMATLALSSSAHSQHDAGLPMTFQTPLVATTQTANGIVFDALRPLVLRSVRVPVSGGRNSGAIVRLRDAGGNFLAIATAPANYNGGIVPLGFSVAPGTGYSLVLTGSAGTYFEAATAPNYSQLGVPGLLALQGPVSGAASNYPFFFDWKVDGVADAADWELNQAEASLSVTLPGVPGVNPQLADPFAAQAPRVSYATGWSSGLYPIGYDPRLFFGSSLVGQGFDLILSATSLIRGSAGAAVTAAGQVVNVDLTSPSSTFLFSGGLPSAMPAVPGSAALQFNSMVPITASVQMVVLDPASADGVALSQALEARFQTPSPVQDFETLSHGAQGSVLPGWIDPGFSNSFPTVWIARDTVQGAATTRGPLAAYSGNVYMTVQTRQLRPNATYELLTPPMEASRLTANRLEFALSRIGSATGTLRVWQIDGPGLGRTLLATYTGSDPSQARGGNEWSLESIPFTPTGQAVGFLFDYTWSAAAGLDGEIAIDLVSVL